MADGSEKQRKIPALVLMSVAVIESFGSLWVAHGLEVADLHHPSDMSPDPLVIFALRTIFFASIICACLLLPFLYTKLDYFYESLFRTAVAMALTPWTAFVCAILVLPLFPIGFFLAPVSFFAGMIAPYIVAARWQSGRV